MTLRVKPRSCPPDRGNGRAGAFGRTASPDGLAFGSRVPPGRRQKSPIGDPASKTPDSSRSYFRYSRSGRADRPGGTHDFSPAIHRWDAVASPSLPCVPEGRARRRRRGQLCGGEKHSPVSCSLPPRPGRGGTLSARGGSALIASTPPRSDRAVRYTCGVRLFRALGEIFDIRRNSLARARILSRTHSAGNPFPRTRERIPAGVGPRRNSRPSRHPVPLYREGIVTCLRVSR